METAACEFVTDGAGTAFCDSKLYKGLTSAFNNVLNNYIEGPITGAMASVEDCAGKAVKSIFSGFCSLFQ